MKDELTRKEFEDLLKKSAQPLQELDSTSGETSESENSGDCSEMNTRSDKTGDI